MRKRINNFHLINQTVNKTLKKTHGNRLYDREAILKEVFERIEDGETVNSICENDDSMPTPKTVYYWIYADETLTKRFDNYRKVRAVNAIEETLEIADKTEMGKERLAKLRIETRKLYADSIGQSDKEQHGDLITLSLDAEAIRELRNVALEAKKRLESDS